MLRVLGVFFSAANRGTCFHRPIHQQYPPHRAKNQWAPAVYRALPSLPSTGGSSP